MSEEKYHKLLAAYTELKQKNAVMKKALRDDAEKRGNPDELRMALRQRDQRIRELQQEMDTVAFQREQLAKRVELLQSDLKGKKTKKTSSKKKDEAMRVQEEELQRKIEENARLHTRLRDLSVKNEQLTAQQEMAIAEAKESLALENQALMGKLNKKEAELISAHQRTHALEQEVGKLQESVTAAQRERRAGAQEAHRQQLAFLRHIALLRMKMMLMPCTLSDRNETFSQFTPRHRSQSKLLALRKLQDGVPHAVSFITGLTSFLAYLAEKVSSMEKVFGSPLSDASSALLTTLSQRSSRLKPVAANVTIWMETGSPAAFVASFSDATVYLNAVFSKYRRYLASVDNLPSASDTLRKTNARVLESFSLFASILLRIASLLRISNEPAPCDATRAGLGKVDDESPGSGNEATANSNTNRTNRASSVAGHTAVLEAEIDEEKITQLLEDLLNETGPFSVSQPSPAQAISADLAAAATRSSSSDVAGASTPVHRVFGTKVRHVTRDIRMQFAFYTLPGLFRRLCASCKNLATEYTARAAVEQRVFEEAGMTITQQTTSGLLTQALSNMATSAEQLLHFFQVHEDALSGALFAHDGGPATPFTPIQALAPPAEGEQGHVLRGTGALGNAANAIHHRQQQQRLKDNARVMRERLLVVAEDIQLDNAARAEQGFGHSMGQGHSGVHAHNHSSSAHLLQDTGEASAANYSERVAALTDQLELIQHEKEQALLEVELLKVRVRSKHRRTSSAMSAVSAESDNDTTGITETGTEGDDGSGAKTLSALDREEFHHREELLKVHFSTKINQLTEQLKYADSKAMAFYEECKILAFKLQRVQTSRDQQSQNVKLAKKHGEREAIVLQSKIADLEDRLGTTHRAFEEQIRTLQDTIVSLTNQVVDRQQQLDAAKARFGNF